MRYLSVSTLASAVLVAAFCTPAWSRMADPAAANGGEPTIYLGKVAVTGQENIVRTLQAIKLALKTPFSSDAAHADVVVCRINKVLGEVREYLDCATNRYYTARRDSERLQILSTIPPSGGPPALMVAVEHLIDQQPENRLHVPVSGGNLQKLLDSIPLPAPTSTFAPASTPAAAPSATTHAPGGAGWRS